MTTALYRVTLWRTKKKGVSLVRLVSETSPESAVCCAQQWVQWMNEAGRGKRAKCDRYRVETRTAANTWNTFVEGTLDDAKAQQPAETTQEHPAWLRSRQLIGQQGTTTRQGRPRSQKVGQPTSRLAAMVAKVKARK